MPRLDISDKLIHFTRGEDHEHAFRNLCSILSDGYIRGSNSTIRGSYTCVCFTEAPLTALSRTLANIAGYSRYSAFGILYEKAYIYSLGGRPVIYQADNEFDELSDSTKWRHVRYDPNCDPPIDFTWEREWASS